MGDKKANEHKPVGSEQKAHRVPFGRKSKAQVNATAFRILGEDADGKKTKILDVAAFNSFIG